MQWQVGIRGIREVVHVVWTDASPFVKARLGCAISLLVVASVLTSLAPVALKLIVDRFAADPRSAHGDATPIYALVALYVGCLWIARNIGEIRGLVYSRAERRMCRALSERLFAHVMRLPMRFHLHRQTGAISQTLDNGLQGYQLVLHHLVFTVLPVAAELGTLMGVLIALRQPAFLALFALAMISYTVAFSSFAVRIGRAARTASNAHLEASAIMVDGILNYETVKLFAAESLVQERVSRALSRTEEEWVAFYRGYACNGLTVAAIFAVFLTAAVGYAAYRVQLGRMSIGDFVLITAYMLQVLRPVEMLGYAMQGFSQGTAMLGKMLELLQEPTEADVSRIATHPVRGVRATPRHDGQAGELIFEHVGLAYRAGRSALTDVTFRLPAGRTLAVVGASGAGKSTLVRLLLRLYEPDTGRILLDGVPTSQLPLDELRRAVAVVPQDTTLFNDTFRFNIAFGKPGCTPAEVEAAARLASLHEFIVGLPEGYDTKVGERGIRLSGGEKQRVSIARAAIRQPRIYVFDEATSSLDSQSESAILHSLRGISRRRTTLIIAHRLSTIIDADEIVVLEAGSAIERGTHTALLMHGGRYAALWQAQQHGPRAA